MSLTACRWPAVVAAGRPDGTLPDPRHGQTGRELSGTIARVGEERRDDNGRAWIVWVYDGYAASLQGGNADPTIYDEGIGPSREDGIKPVTLAEAVEWALARTDWVIARPRWDQAVHYWAGRGPAPHIPELEQDEIPLLPRDAPE